MITPEEHEAGLLIREVDAHRDGGRYILSLGYHLKMNLSYGLATQVVRCLQKALKEKSQHDNP